jgi:hypothetical protein
MGARSSDVLYAQLRSKPSELAKFLSSFVPIDAYEITDAAAAAAAALRAGFATTVAVQVWLAADLLAPGKAALAAYPRRVQFTTAGGTPAHAPATATVAGKDAKGLALEETINLAQTATTADGVKFFSEITSVTFSAGDGTGATIAMGFTAAIGFKETPKLRNAAVAAVQEFTNGVPSGTRGTYITPASGAPYGGVTFNTAPNGTNDYTVYFEREV